MYKTMQKNIPPNFDKTVYNGTGSAININL